MECKSFLNALPFLRLVDSSTAWPPQRRNATADILLSGSYVVSIEPESSNDTDAGDERKTSNNIGPAFFGCPVNQEERNSNFKIVRSDKYDGDEEKEGQGHINNNNNNFDPSMFKFDVTLMTIREETDKKCSTTTSMEKISPDLLAVEGGGGGVTSTSISNNNQSPFLTEFDSERKELYFRFNDNDIYLVDCTHLIDIMLDFPQIETTRIKSIDNNGTCNTDGHHSDQRDKSETKEMSTDQVQKKLSPALPPSILFCFNFCTFRAFTMPNPQQMYSTNDRYQQEQEQRELSEATLQSIIPQIRTAITSSSLYHPFLCSDLGMGGVVTTPQDASTGSSTAGYKSSNEPGQKIDFNTGGDVECDSDDNYGNNKDRNNNNKESSSSSSYRIKSKLNDNDDCGDDDGDNKVIRRMKKRKLSYQRSWKGLQSLKAVLDMPSSAFPATSQTSGLSEMFGPLLTATANDLSKSYCTNIYKDRVDIINEFDKEYHFHQNNFDGILNKLFPPRRNRNKDANNNLNRRHPITCTARATSGGGGGGGGPVMNSINSATPQQQQLQCTAADDDVQDLIQNAKDIFRKQREVTFSRHMLSLLP